MKKLNIILTIALGIVLWLYFAKEVEVKTVTKTTIEYSPEVAELPNTKPKEIKIVKIKVPIKGKTIKDTIWQDKEVKKYTYKDTLQNGILTSTILADKIYKRDILLKTFNKTVITNTKKTVFKSALYIGGTTILNNDKSVANVSINLFYTHRNKFLIGGLIGYGYGKPNVGLTFAIKF